LERLVEGSRYQPTAGGLDANGMICKVIDVRGVAAMFITTVEDSGCSGGRSREPESQRARESRARRTVDELGRYLVPCDNDARPLRLGGIHQQFAV
jgi:hypothetical protein